MTTETAVGGNEYRIGKLPPFKQFHIARRLAPILSAIGSAALSLPNDAAPAVKQAASDEDDFAALLKFVGPIASSLSQLSDDDTEYVLNTCLGAVQRKSGNGWAKVLASNSKLMFEDIDLPTMTQLTIAVIKENLGSFFPEPPALSSQTGG